ncbi:MAG: ADP-ribosylglycohydrolase family protein [Ancrocorticia sp.]|jgi:ADP-ribosylglycohydrolase|nr:ADP-ribosylglycohydrolase family protein [Ancrocorticia sp.]MCI2002945.1 ADP-ribosylglycohydrolase family protein [Ancrocorticia sp.]MCI2012640.1 ADP-ribosylglycohydrolase family protein [Ancrocorticia sp.]MCI2029213.1 ADP-ribosylglycohydrolase family protein [Ancrocorticia sp.]MCI2179160.1 ADP-ribosylglycohydrolase family protein [Ancrocorticia sp.]
MNIPAPAQFPAPEPVELTPEILDRARGTLLAAACGDALGVPYEFDPRRESNPQMIGGGLGPYAPGQWSDDTEMSICVAKVAATGLPLTGGNAPDRIGANFLDWLRDGALDVGIQTRAVLEAAQEMGRGDISDRLTQAARDYAAQSGRGAGNGALMRTAPVGLVSLGSRETTARAAIAVARLTHADPLVDDSCVLWSEAIRHAVMTGEIAIRPGLDLLNPDSAAYWSAVIDDAEAGKANAHQNGFTVNALACAWQAVWGARGLSGEAAIREGIVGAIRLGSDTDTVASIAGSLLGAAHGASSVPAEWVAVVHGWPGMTATEYADLGEKIVRETQRRVLPSD